MTGFNLPPGCNVSDIPGNSPDEIAADDLMDEVFEKVESETDKDALALWVLEKLADTYAKAYQRGMSDEAMARESNENSES